MLANAIFHKVFMTLEGYSAIFVFLGSSGICIFKSAQYNCQLTSLVFHTNPGGFRYLFGENFTPRCHQTKFYIVVIRAVPTV